MKYWKYIVGFLIVVVPSALTVLVYNDKITQNSPMYYKQGVQFYNDGDYSNAYYNFGKIKWISPLYPMALYKQAKSAQKAGDYKTAAIKYKMFLNKMPNSIFDTKAKLNLAKSYYYLKQFDDAKKQFTDLKQSTNNLGTEEVYFLGLIEKKTDKNKSASYFRDYINTVLAGNALNSSYLIPAADELSSLGVNLDNNDNKSLGIAYFKNKNYKKALNYFSKLPVNTCWDYLVLTNHYEGNKVIAKKLIETGLPLYSVSTDEENLHEIYNIYATYFPSSKIKNWTLINKIVKENSLQGEDYVMYKLASLLPKDKAVVIYNNIVEKYPESSYAPESLWNVFWDKYTKKDYKTAEELAIKHLKSYKKVKSTPKVAFWLAKTALKQNKTAEAHNYLTKLAAKYPDNYYGLRAENIISKKNDFWTTNIQNKIPEQKEEIEFPLSIGQLDIKDVKLINTLFEMGDYEIWIDANFQNPIVESWFELKKDKKSRSIVLARDEIEKMEVKPPLISSSYKLDYPRYWVEEINIAGQKLNIDPYLIEALIREESYFNENAKSKTGATGLMQIMPQTANYVISKLDEDMKTLANLENPRINIYIGSNYLKYLKERFNNDDLMVIAAYNGGEGSVNKWQKNYGTEDYDEFIEQIPYEETRNYIKRVFTNYHMYRKIYK